MKGVVSMKKVLISSLALMMFFTGVVVLAQEATAPAPTASKAPTSAPAVAASAGLTVSRMELANSIENRQPVGTATSFPANTEKVYCYVELKDVPKDTSITFAWSHGQNDMGKVIQQIKKSSRWRTWSSKTIGDMKGDWKVDVLDESGAVLKSVTFKVE